MVLLAIKCAQHVHKDLPNLLAGTVSSFITHMQVFKPLGLTHGAPSTTFNSCHSYCTSSPNLSLTWHF